MTFEEIVAKTKEEIGAADVSNYEGHLALQINVTGEGEGAFYAEINDGKLYIEPFDYKDNDAVLTAQAEDIISIFNGTLSAMEAVQNGKLFVDGNWDKAFSIIPVIEEHKKASKKTVRKTAAKTASKTTAKAASKTTKTTAKSASKTTAKKTEESPAIIGLAEPKKTPSKSTAPKAAKKTADKAAKESTKPVKAAAKTTAKKG